MSRLIKKMSFTGVLAVALAFALPQAATAVVIPLTLTGPIAGNTVGPQSTSNPCIIAGTQCSNPAGFGFNNFVQGGTSAINAYSTTPTATLLDGVQGTPYTVAQINGVVGSTFSVALDVNTTGAKSETLDLFEVIINGVVAYSYVGPTVVGNVDNNGNGFADWTLGTISLVGLNPNDTVLFHAKMSNLVDGAESFFIVPGTPNPPTVPEPASLVLLGAGMSALGLLRYRKGRQ